jgi:small-conductance mechanosensitive channel
MNNVLISIGISVGAVFLGLVLQIFLSFLFSRWRNRRLSPELRANLKPESWRGPMRALLPALLLILALPLLRISPSLLAVIRQVLWIWIIGSAAWLTLAMVTVIKNFILKRYRIDAKDNLLARRVYTQLGVIERILKILIVFLSVALILLTFEKVRQVGFSLLASAGIVGIILGFSAQKSLATLFTPHRFRKFVKNSNGFWKIPRCGITGWECCKSPAPTNAPSNCAP